jgi:hypothetical protein
MVEKIANITVEKGEVLIISNRDYLIEGEIIVNGRLIIRNANLKFSPNAKIVGRNCFFINENTNFFMTRTNSFSLINTVGYIKNSNFQIESIKNTTQEDKLKNNLPKSSIHIEGRYSKDKYIYAFYKKGKPSTENLSYLQNELQFRVLNSKFQGEFHIRIQSVFIEDSIFSYCLSNDYGSVEVKNSIVKNCIFYKCQAKWGGGVYSLNSIITNTQFIECHARNNGGGGFISNTYLTDCSFISCSAKGFGGGLVLYDFNYIKNCVFYKCSAKKGGGISAYDTNHIENCKFFKCSAEEDKSINFSPGRVNVLKNNLIFD